MLWYLVVSLWVWSEPLQIVRSLLLFMRISNHEIGFPVKFQKQHQLKQFQIKIKGNWRKGPFPKITAITFCIFTWCWGNPWAVSVCCCSKLSVVPSDCIESSSDWNGNKTLGSSVWKIKNQWYNKKVISITEICNTKFPWRWKNVLNTCCLRFWQKLLYYSHWVNRINWNWM